MKFKENKRVEMSLSETTETRWCYNIGDMLLWRDGLWCLLYAENGCPN